MRIIRDHRLDLFKIDYNVRVYEGRENERHVFLEDERWREMEVLDAAFERVPRELLYVARENCAGTGGRLEIGMMSRFHYSCESDFSNFPNSMSAINELTHFAPPEALCYYHNHLYRAHQTADLSTHLRDTFFAMTIFVGFGAQKMVPPLLYSDQALNSTGHAILLTNYRGQCYRLSPFASHW